MGKLDQELIPDEVAEAVIDGLEAVEVQEEHGKAIGRASLGMRYCLCQPIEEQGAIRQTRERIMQRLVLQLLLGLFLRGDILNRANSELGIVGCIAQETRPSLHR